MWAGNDKRWLLIFTPLCLFVVGLLLYLHLSNSEEVPKTRQWTHEKVLYVCEAPDWVVKNVEPALEFVKPWSTYSAVVKTEGPCSGVADVIPDCEYNFDDDGDGEVDRTRVAPCVVEAHLLTGASQDYKFGQGDEGGHGDEGLWSANVKTGALAKVTTMFPEDLDMIMPVPEDLETAPAFPLPNNVEFLVVVHALLHAEGYDHVFTPLPWPFKAEPTGHIMQKDIRKLGESTAGL